MNENSFFYNSNRKGLTLVEVVIVCSIVCILAALAAIGRGFTGTERIRSAAKELLADIQWIRYSAITQGPDAACQQLRGLGIRFESGQRYHLFRFNDGNGNFIYDGVEEERPLHGGESGTRLRDIGASVGLKIKKSGALVNPDNTILLFDHHGIPRQSNLGFQQMSIIFHHKDLPEVQGKCVSVSFNRIREGIWNENECQEQ